MADLNTKISFHFSKLLESANGSYLVLHDEQEEGPATSPCDQNLKMLLLLQHNKLAAEQNLHHGQKTMQYH